MKKPILLVAALLASMTAPAQETFTTVINQIISHNAELKSASHTITADSYDATDANSLAPTSVDFSRVWGSNHVGNKLQLDVSQEFEWPGVYAMRSRAARAAQSTAELQLVAQRLDVALEAKQQMIELVYTRKQLDLLTRLYSQMTDLSKVVDANREKEMVTLLDQRKVTIELYKLDNQIAQLQATEQDIINKLQGMCAGCVLDLSNLTEYPIEKIETAETYISQIKTLDPQLAAQSMAAEEQALQGKTAIMQRFPSFSVGYQHQAEMGDRFNGFTVGVSLPFFQGRKAKAAAMERREAALLGSETLVNEKTAAVNNTLQQMEIWHQQTLDYNKVFGDNAYPVLLEKAYHGGELSVLDYIGEVQYYTEATLTCLETDYLYHRALTDLNKYSLLD